MLTRRFASALVLSLASISIASAVAPGPPQNLTASVSGNNVTFTWQAPSTGGVPSSYMLEAALSPGGVPIATLPVTSGPFTVPGVPNGVYYVAVRGVNADGSSERSNEVIISVPSGGGGCTSAPNSPTNLSVSAVGNEVTVTWGAPVGGCAATSYVVQAGSAPGLSNVAVVNVGAATSLSASAPGGTYYIRVLGLNAYGGSTATSERTLTIAATPAPTPPPTTPPPTTRVRIGAICNDGTQSSATGSGACSSHGGVSCWRYSDGSCTNPDLREPAEMFASDDRSQAFSGAANSPDAFCTTPEYTRGW
jgi:predicted phage tail protein